MESRRVEVGESQKMEAFLRSAEIDFRLAPGAVKTSLRKDGHIVETVSVDFPGKYDETPDKFIFVKTKPERGSGPVRIEIKYTRRELNEGAGDVENITQNAIFELRHRLIGGISVGVVGGNDNMVGMRTFYADSDTPRFSVKKVDDPYAFVREIVARFKRGSFRR